MCARFTWVHAAAGSLLMLAVALRAPATPAALSRGLEAGERSARQLPINDAAGSRQLPFAGFSVFQPARNDWIVFTFYLMFREKVDEPARRRDSYWVARRVAGTDRRKAPGPIAEWASSDQCAGLDHVVRSMSDLLDERLEAALPGESDTLEADVAPMQFRAWTDQGRFRGSGHAVSISVDSTAGSPLAQWATETTAALAPCWTMQQPKATGGAAATRRRQLAGTEARRPVGAARQAAP